MSKVNFVIVDDAEFMRIMLKKILGENENFNILAEGSNGSEAIKLAETYKPDIMTLDITMPEVSGIEAIPEVLKVSPNTRIIMVSAMGQQSMVMEAIKLGARDFVIKPFEKSTVYQSIQNVLST